jgi:hypothetical protein
MPFADQSLSRSMSGCAVKAWPFCGHEPWPEPTTNHERVFVRVLDQLRAENPGLTWSNIRMNHQLEWIAGLAAERLIRADDTAKRAKRWPWQKQVQRPLLTEEVHRNHLQNRSSVNLSDG